MVLRLEQHLVVGGVRDGAAAGQRGEAGVAPPAQQAVDRVVVQQRAVASAARGVTLGEHAHDAHEVLADEFAIRPGAAQQRVKPLLVPLARRRLGDDLLGQHVQRTLGDDQAVQLAAAHAVEQCGAFDQLVARQRKQPPLGRAADAVAGAPNALQEGGDGARRSELADQIHLADVDAQLQRGGGHQRAQLAPFEALLGVKTFLLGQAAVMRRHVLLAQALGEMPGHALGQAPRVDEHQRGAVLAHQLGQAVVDQLPDLVGHHRFQRRDRHLQRQVARSAVAAVDDGAVGGLRAVRAGADQEARHVLDGFLRGRQADALQRTAG